MYIVLWEFARRSGKRFDYLVNINYSSKLNINSHHRVSFSYGWVFLVITSDLLLLESILPFIALVILIIRIVFLYQVYCQCQILLIKCSLGFIPLWLPCYLWHTLQLISYMWWCHHHRIIFSEGHIERLIVHRGFQLFKLSLEQFIRLVKVDNFLIKS